MPGTQLTGPALSDVHGRPLTKAALAFAAERHEGQLLDGDRPPFVQHPLEVAALLSGAGYQDDVVASGVLHDVLETTDTTAAELERRFGGRVAALVEAVTEDEAIADRSARKSALRAQVGVRRLRSRTRAGAAGGEARAKLDHYRASLWMLERRLGGRHRLVERLRRELELLHV